MHKTVHDISRKSKKLRSAASGNASNKTRSGQSAHGMRIRIRNR